MYIILSNVPKGSIFPHQGVTMRLLETSSLQLELKVAV